MPAHSRREFFDSWRAPAGFWMTCFVSAVSNLKAALEERGERHRACLEAEKRLAESLWSTGNDVY